MNSKLIIAAGAAASALMLAGGAYAFPGYGNDSLGPTILITFGPGGSESITQATAQGPYDGSDDTYIGVVNNSGATINSFTVSSTTDDIFGFDSDGIDNYGAVENVGNHRHHRVRRTERLFHQHHQCRRTWMSGTVNFTRAVSPTGEPTISRSKNR